MDHDEPPLDQAGLARDLLAWYRAFGVDDAVGDIAVDWLSRGDLAPGSGFRLSGGAGARQPEASRADAAPSMPSQPSAGPSRQLPRTEPPRAQPPPAAPRQFPTASPDEAVTAARAAARQASSLAELREQLLGFNGCALKATAKNLCFFRGAEKARLMLIGEAPGREEDLAGMPFVGPAVKLLDKMLAAIGLAEADVHITNSVYWRPPGNRTPSPQETQACRPFLDRQIELVAPDVIALLGGAAVNSLLGVEGGIMRLRGNWRELEAGGRRIRVMPTLHPAFLLRSPANKRQAWRDMLALAEALEG
jgi:DNA polymerase